MVLGVLAENNLPLKMSSVLIDTAKELAKDKKMLDSLSMGRTTASYRMPYGLAKTFRDETVNNIHNRPFSLNIDESTSNNHKRVLAVLVSYYSAPVKTVVVEHLASLELFTCNAQTLYDMLDELFKKHEISWSNLVSILMDSCAVMRGSKSGLESRIRSNKTLHLLDIDGDICHHIHNSCKKFCSPFERWAECLFSDLYNDIKWSPDLQQLLSEVFELINIKYTMPERFMNHRWLSVYDLSVSTLRIMDALLIFYYAFLPKEDKTTYHAIIVSIYRKRQISMESRERLREIINKLGQKSLTDDGKARKARINSKLHFQSLKSKLILHFYQSALPLLKSYVCLFQSKQPLIHLVHDKIEELFRDFLACFVKPEVLPSNINKLKLLNLNDKTVLLKKGQIFTGNGVKSLLEDYEKNDKTVVEFQAKALSSYVECVKYLQHKLSLENKILQAISAIDPVARGHSKTTKALKYLEEQLPFLNLEQKEKFALQVQQFQVDLRLSYTAEERIDTWWAKVSSLGKYDQLCKIVFAVLSIFHGPQVESSFNTMGDVIDIRSCQMKVETYSAIQTVKYHLKARGVTSVQHFKRKDLLHSPVDKNLCINMKNSASEYKLSIQKRKQASDDRKQRLKLKANLLSKAKAKKHIAKTEKAARKLHKTLMQSRKPASSVVSSKSKNMTPLPDKALQGSTCSPVIEMSPQNVSSPSKQLKRKMRIQVLEELVQKKVKKNMDSL